MREDLSAQRRNRKDATPIPSRRDSPNGPRPSVAESYHSATATIEPDGGPKARPVTYLELEGGPVPAIGGEVINITGLLRNQCLLPMQLSYPLKRRLKIFSAK